MKYKNYLFGLLFIFMCFICVNVVSADDDVVVEKQCKYEREGKIIVFDIGSNSDGTNKYSYYRLNEKDTNTGRTIETYANKIKNWDVTDDINIFSGSVFLKRNDKCPKYFLDGSFNSSDSWFAYSKEAAKKLQESLDYDTELFTRYDGKKTSNDDKDDIQVVCGILTPNAQEFIYRILDWIKYIALILTVALSILDFFKAMSSEEDDSFKKAASKLAKRIIVVVVLFLLPVLLEFVLKLVHIQGINSSDPMCMK